MGETTSYDPRQTGIILGAKDRPDEKSGASPETDPRLTGRILDTSFRTVPSATNGEGGAWGEIKRNLGLGTRATIEGLTDLGGMALNAATYPGRVMNEALFGPQNRGTPPTELLRKAETAAGLPSPATPSEQTVSNMVHGGASTLPMLAAGGIPAVVSRAPMLATPGAVQSGVQVVGGAAGAGAGQAAQESPIVPESLKPYAGLAANLIAGGATSAIGGRAMNAATGTPSEIMAAFDRLGVKPRTAGMLHDNPDAVQMEASAVRLPGGAGVLKPAIRATTEDVGNAVDETAALLSERATGGQGPPIRSAEDAGRFAQKELQDWRFNTQRPDGFSATQDRMYAPVNARMQGGYVDPSGYRTALERAASDVELSRLPDVQKAFARGEIQKHLDALNKNAVPGQMLTWEEAQAIRKNVGDLLTTPDIAGKMGPQRVRSIYGGIAQDLQQAANGAGVGKQFADANLYSTAGHQFVENVASRGTRSANSALEMSPEESAKALLDSGDTGMAAMRVFTPKAADALGAYKLRQMQLAPPGSSGVTGYETSTNTLLTNLNRMRQQNPGTERALFGDHPLVAQRIGDLRTVTNQMREISKLVNYSGTGGATAMLHGISGVPWVTARALTNPATLGYLGGARTQRLPPSLLGEAATEPQGQQ